MKTLEELKEIVNKLDPGGLSLPIVYLSYWSNIFCSFACKESAGNFPIDNLVWSYQDLSGKHFKSFLALCKLLKVPLKKGDYTIFQQRKRLWVDVRGWCNENPLNREVARFLAKASYYGQFTSIKLFSANHYLSTHYSIANYESFETTFYKFISNLKQNLNANKDVNLKNYSGIVQLLLNHKLKLTSKETKV